MIRVGNLEKHTFYKEWEVIPLNKLVKDSAYGINASAVEYDVNLPRYLRITDIGEDGSLKNDNPKSVDHPKSDNFILQENDIVFARTGNTVGKTYLYNPNDGILVFAGYLIKFALDSDKMYPLYFFYLTQTQEYEHWVKIMSARSGQPGINTQEFLNMKIPVPPIYEQQKIASILSTWDEAIDLYLELLANKREYFQGLSERLLSQKKSWNSYCLGDVGITYTGLTGKRKEDFGEGKKYIPYKNIFNNSKIDIDDFELVQISSKEKQNKIKYEDVIFTTSSETPGEVGMSSVVLDNIDEDIYLNSFCFGYRFTKDGIISPNFSRFYFRGKEFRKNMYRLAQGSTRFNLSKNEFLKIVINIPPLKEQRNIAQILEVHEKEMSLIESMIDQLQEQKRGLMQLLLTGKVRV